MYFIEVIDRCLRQKNWLVMFANLGKWANEPPKWKEIPERLAGGVALQRGARSGGARGGVCVAGPRATGSPEIVGDGSLWVFLWSHQHSVKKYAMYN